MNLTIITKHGASGDYPSCTDLSYKQAILDGADFIDCPVQMSKDRIPFCSPSVNLISGTNVIRSKYSNYAMTIPELMSSSGIFALNLTWDEIRTLTRKFILFSFSLLLAYIPYLVTNVPPFHCS